MPHGPITRECDPSFSHSDLSQSTYYTNKHNHFKEIREWVYQKYVFCHKKDIWPLMGPLLVNVTLLIPFWFESGDPPN